MKTKYWIIIIFIIMFTGCKPKQIIQKRVVTKTDSTAITKLQDSIYKYEVRIGILQTDLERYKEENYNLLSEVSRYETYYDTDKPIVPETGKPPVSSKITTISKSQLEKTLKEYEKLNTEYRIENESITRINRNQELIIESLKDENRELKEKAIPNAGFNFNSFIWGILAGIVLIILLLIFIKK